VTPQLDFPPNLLRLDDGDSATALIAAGGPCDEMWANLYTNARFSHWFWTPHNIAGANFFSGRPIWFQFARQDPEAGKEGVAPHCHFFNMKLCAGPVHLVQNSHFERDPRASWGVLVIPTSPGCIHQSALISTHQPA
jgi:hypothetical protein